MSAKYYIERWRGPGWYAGIYKGKIFEIYCLDVKNRQSVDKAYEKAQELDLGIPFYCGMTPLKEWLPKESLW